MKSEVKKTESKIQDLDDKIQGMGDELKNLILDKEKMELRYEKNKGIAIEN